MANKGKFAVWNRKIGAMQLAVLDLFDPTEALPADPAVDVRYIALATANGWTKDHIYQWTGSAWEDASPALNMQVEVLNKSANYWFGEDGWVIISVATRSGRNPYLQSMPSPRAAEWNGSAVNQHTVRRGRASWAKPRA